MTESPELGRGDAATLVDLGSLDVDASRGGGFAAFAGDGLDASVDFDPALAAGLAASPGFVLAFASGAWPSEVAFGAGVASLRGAVVDTFIGA